MKRKFSRWARIAAVLLTAFAVLSLGSCDDLIDLLLGEEGVDLTSVTPSGLAAGTVTATSVSLTWNAVTGATGYKVFRGVAASSLAQIASVTSAAYTDTTVASDSVYYYAVNAFNADGSGPQCLAISVTTPQTASDTAAVNVAVGISLLQQDPPDIDGAMNQFALAAAADPSNAQAVLWNALMTLASKSVSPAMRSLASDYIGIVEYPTAMNDLFLGDDGPPAWLTMQAVTGSYFEYPYVGTGNGDYQWNDATMQHDYVGTGNGDRIRETHLNYGMFPEIMIPTGVSSMDGDAATLAIQEYLMALAINVIENNPTGFNDLVDHVVDDIIGSSIDQLVSSLQSIGDDAAIEVTYDMFTDNALNWPQDANDNPVTLVFGKAEMLAIAGYLQSVKTLALMGKSVSLAFPAQQYWDALNPLDTDNQGLYSGSQFPTAAFLAAVYALPTPFSQGFLYARSDAALTLADAKTAYLAAMDNFASACTQMIARTSTSIFTLSPGSPIDGFATQWTTYIKNYIRFAKVLAEKTAASVEDGTPMYVPTPRSSWYNGGNLDMNLVAADLAYAANWPDGADEGPYTAPPTAVAVNLGPMFANPLFAFDALFEMDVNGEPVWYPFDVTFTVDALDDALTTQINEFSYLPSAVAPPTGATAYAPITEMTSAQAILWADGTALKSVTATGDYTMRLFAPRVKDLTFGGTFPISPTMLANLKDVLVNVILGMATNPTEVAQMLAIWDTCFVQDGDGSISAYLPTIPAFVAYNSFSPYSVASPETLSLDLDGNATFEKDYKVKGSYWWALPTDFMYCGTLFGQAY